MSPSIWATAVFLGGGTYCLQNKEVHQGLCFLLCGCKMQQFAFSLDGCPSIPLPLDPKWLYWRGISLNLHRVYIPPSWVLVSYQGFKVLATFCSVSWNSIMPHIMYLKSYLYALAMKPCPAWWLQSGLSWTGNSLQSFSRIHLFSAGPRLVN